MFYVLFDTEQPGYMKDTFSNRRYTLPSDGKLYKRLHAAIESASLINVDRNIPPGWTPKPPFKPYQNRPQVVVHEVDTAWNVIAVHSAPPKYIIIP